MIRSKSLSGSALSLFLIAATAEAATEPAPTADPTDSPVSLGEVVVTATRYEESTERVPADVSVITEEDISASTARDVPGILKPEVGLHVYDITGNGRLTGWTAADSERPRP